MFPVLLAARWPNIFRLQPAENAVLAPIMLYGPPEQQNVARAFISTKLNKSSPEACDALVAKLKETVKQDDEGTWVRTFLVGCLFNCMFALRVGLRHRALPDDMCIVLVQCRGLFSGTNVIASTRGVGSSRVPNHSKESGSTETNIHNLALQPLVLACPRVLFVNRVFCDEKMYRKRL